MSPPIAATPGGEGGLLRVDLLARVADRERDRRARPSVHDEGRSPVRCDLPRAQT